MFDFATEQVRFVRVPCPKRGWTVRLHTRDVGKTVDDGSWWLKTKAERKKRPGRKRKHLSITSGQAKKRSRREAVFDRSRGLCQFGGCIKEATELHHIVPRHEGGTNVVGNLQGLCHTHHMNKHPEHKKLSALEQSYRCQRDDHEGLYPAMPLPAAFA